MKKPLKIITAFGAFVGTFLVYHIIGSNFFPVSEDNVLQAPNWYPILGIAIAAVVSFLSVKGKKVSKEIINIVKNDIAENKRYYCEMKGETFSSPRLEISEHGGRDNLEKDKDEVESDFDMAVLVSIAYGYVSESVIERRLNISYDKARDITKKMESLKMCEPFCADKKRRILISENDYFAMKHKGKIQERPAERSVPIKDRDPMEIIRIMERRFEEQYQFAYKHLFNLHDCQKMYEQTVKEFDSIELPLMAQMRFEQLCAEYKEKFNITNPFVVVDAMDGHAFEEWCAELLRKNGFVDVEVTPGSGDQGVDVIAVKEGVRYAIQCKCYSSDLSNKPVQEVHTGKSIYKCQVGVVMTNRHFTIGAKEAAEATGVLLWDRDKLEELIDNAKAGE